MHQPSKHVFFHKKRTSHLAFTLLACLFLISSNAFGFDLLISTLDEVGAEPFPRNGEVTYTIDTQNSQADIALGVTTIFPIPTNTVYVSHDDGVLNQCTYETSPDRVECDYDDLLGTAASPEPGPVKNLLVTIRANIPPGTYTFNATASVTPVNPLNAGNNTATQNTSISDAADLTTTLTASPTTVTGGGDIVYTSTVTNNGPNTAVNNIDVVFQLSPNVTWVSNSGTNWICNYNSGFHQITCTRTLDLAAGVSAPDISFTARVSEVTGTVTTTATIPPHSDDPNPNNNVTTNDVTVTAGTDVAVTISASSPVNENPTGADNNTSAIIISPRNNGPWNAEDVEVIYTIPEGFTIETSPTGAGWTCNETFSSPNWVVTCNRVGNAAYTPGSTDDISLVLRVPAWSAGPKPNPVTIYTTTAEASERLANNTHSTDITLIQAGVDLGLTKTKSPSLVMQGDQITSTFVVHNYGPLDFDYDPDTITLTDTLTANQEEYVSYSGLNWRCPFPAANIVTCYYEADLLNGAPTTTLTIITTATATGLGATETRTLTNQGLVSYSGTPGDINTSNDDDNATVTVTSRKADLRITKAAIPGSIAWNENTITYTINVCNHDDLINPDNADATGITLIDPIAGYYSGPVGSTGVSYTYNTANYDPPTGTSTLTFTQKSGVFLALSDCVNSPVYDTFTITVDRPLYSGNQTNTATVSTNEVIDTNNGNNSASATVTIDPLTDMRVQNKTVTPNQGDPNHGYVKSGVNATYVITVRNNGPSTADNVEVKDTFNLAGGDTGFTFVSFNAPGGGDCSIGSYSDNMVVGNSYTSADSPEFTCQWDSVEYGGTRTITMVIRPNYMVVSDPYLREFQNSVEVTTDTPDSNSANDTFGPVTLTIERDEIDLLINNNDTPDPVAHNPLGVPADNPENDVVYHVDYRNNGPSLATGVNFVFTMTPKADKEVEFMCDEAGSGDSCGTNADTCTITGGSNPVTGPATLTLTCPQNDLPATATGNRYLIFRVITEPDPTGDTHNTNAVISANEFESILGNNAEAEATSVRGKVDLVIDKSSTPSTVDQTQAFDWIITVTNNGPSSSRNTVLTDDLSGFSLYDESITWVKTLPAETGTCSLSGSNLTCDFGTIENIGVATVTIPVKVDSGSGFLQNCASVTTDDVDSNALNSTNVCGTVNLNNYYHPSDYGDAPDTDNSTGTGNYQTRLNYGGARHYLDTAALNTPYLGACVDADGAGNLQNSAADADDTTGALDPPAYTVIGTCGPGGDEDGVQIPVLVAGNSINLTVTVGGADCTLSGWIDFNQNGVWTDAGEQVITDLFLDLATATHTVPVTVPPLASISVGNSYARFRCATETGLTPTDSADPLHPDYAADGEVEDYLVSLQPDNSTTYVDYGDAPDSVYPTILASDGPSHILGVGGAPILGNCVDSDTGSQENTAADADDNAPQGGSGSGNTIGTCTDPNDDEDGVIFPLLHADQNANLTIVISNGNCRLNGWIDYNNDGDWSDGGEQIFSNLSRNIGNHTETIAIPNNVAVGNSYARFRCSSSSNNLGPIGAAADGEVEDYQIELLGYIKGQVRMDADDDGVLADPDASIPGVVINLLDADNGNAILATTTTDSSGNYEFLGLSAGNYIVEEIDPADHLSTNDIVAPNDNEVAVTLGNGGSSVGNDFIDTHLSSLGDYVWFDMNQNGIQDIGEQGIAGITVNLYKGVGLTPAGSTITDGNGFYEFIDLRTDVFTVEFVKPAAYTISPWQQGSNTLLDSDADTTTGRSPQYNLPPGTRNSTIDAGMFLTNGDLPARLSNLVWYDTNNDGIQDTGESGVAGVTVNLLDNSDSLISSTTTNGLGIYEFFGLAAGNYIVEFIKPTGYTASPAGAGSNTAIDSNAAISDGKTSTITLVAGENNPDIDAGIFLTGQPPASLGDYVWHDTNQDGVQNADEPGIGNISVSLFNTVDLNTVIATTLTAVDGSYLFSGLPASNYVVHFKLPDNQYLFSPQNAGIATVTTDSDADQLSGLSDTVSLAAGEHNATIDAGLYLFAITPVSIGDFVWLDTDYDNTPDVGEGIGGVDLTLLDLHGNELQKITTAADGSYLFTGLPPLEEYHVLVDTSTLPLGVYQIADPDSMLDSAHTIADDELPPNKLTVDFGYGYNNIIGDYVWLDENRDGIQDPAENGVAGVTVNLLNDSGAQIDTTITDGNGYYEFSLLASADYQVEFVAPTGYLLTIANQGSGALLDSFDSDADPTSGRTPLFTLGHNDINPTLDAGLYLDGDQQPASLGNFVWVDLDAGGLLDPGEPGVSGVVVNLWDGGFASQIATTVTDGSGYYSFYGLAPGTYAVEFVQPASYSFTDQDQGADESLDSDAHIATGRTAAVTLTAGENNIDFDAGLFLDSEGQPASLGNLIWYDNNKNGIQDTGEPGYPGVSIYLYDAGDQTFPLASTVSDGNGNYLFAGLVAGSYIVRFEQPAGQTFSPQGGGTPATDSNADPVTGITAAITLTEGENNLTIDAGVFGAEVVLYTIGDLVWFDDNHNGVPNTGEGMANIDLVLYDLIGNELLRTTTDANGIYGFTGIPAGNYRVAVDTNTLPLDETTQPHDNLIQLADPDAVFDSSHQLIGFNASTDLVDFGYREREVDVELDKTFVLSNDIDGNTIINKDDILTFTIAVVNQGPEAATGVEVTDQLPPGYNLGAVTPSKGNYIEPVWTIGDLAVGESVSLAMEATVTRIKDYLNTAEVTATNEYDFDSTPDNNIEEEDDQSSVRPNVKNFPWELLMAIIPPCPHVPDYCYMVSDRDSTRSNNSALMKYNFETEQVEFVGRLGVGDVEAITLSLDGITLYAVNRGVLGVIDTTPGLVDAFIPINVQGLGVGIGELGLVRFNDIDGLAFDPTTGILYASARRGDDLGGLDMLLQIDTASGTLIKDAFGNEKDYLVVDSADFGVFHTDDIAINSKGIMYGIVENSGGGGGDLLVTIDKNSGVVNAVSEVREGQATIHDIEGLTFYFRDTLFATTGVEFSDEGLENSLFKINAANGQSQLITPLDVEINGFNPYDFEAISCPICE